MVEVRRFLHSNYNCRDLAGLERWYSELFGLKAIMRTESDDTDAWAFGVRQLTHTDTVFLYDHRGARRSTSLELVSWIDPPVVGHPYQFPWEHGIQSVGYTVPDLDEVARQAESGGGRVVKRLGDALLLRDPEGVAVEVFAGAESEARHMRVMVKDLARTLDWYANIGYTPNPEALQGTELWEGDGEHSITGEAAVAGTDDPTYSLIFNTWSGPPPIGPSYGAHFHNGLYRFAVAVDDVHEAYNALRAGGIATNPPYTYQLPGTKITEGLTILFIRDPDGILVELVQRPRSIFK
ncbi:MAG: lactoylglutathione lyase [Acidimicrobiia bacterium]|nr:lactoylglutathione lyase [Acidimicrobiia bacterium]